MINFEEELKKFHPSLEIDEAEDVIINHNMTDFTDILVDMVKEQEKEMTDAVGKRKGEMLRAGGKSKTKSHAGAEPPPALDRQLCGAHLRAAGADCGRCVSGHFQLLL